jgi:hypothetical protein
MKLTSLDIVIASGVPVLDLEFWRLNDPTPYHVIALMEYGVWTDRGYVRSSIPIRTNDRCDEEYEVDWAKVVIERKSGALRWDETQFGSGTEIVIRVGNTGWVRDVILIVDTDRRWFLTSGARLVNWDDIYLPTGMIYGEKDVEITSEFERMFHQYYGG